MTEKDKHPVSLQWTIGARRLTAESFGRPARSICMACHIGRRDGAGIKWVKALGIWDTGATMTVVSPDVARRLQLEPVDSMQAGAVGGSHETVKAYGFVGLPNKKAYGPIDVAIDVLPEGIDVLIGMDVISIGTLTIRRKPDGGTLFTFDMNV